MLPVDVLSHMIGRRNLSTRNASIIFGRSPSYASRMISGRVTLSIGLIAEFGDKLGYDIVLRDREDGEEWIIEPPPPS